MAVTNFIITNAGLAAASVAGSGGPKIDITQFKLGSGVNYTPLPTHTGLNGTTLYTANIAAATPYNNDTMDIVLQIPAAVGPFDFGEIGIYMGSTLFAKCAYTSLQSKLSDAVNGVGSVWTIHALIKLADAAALFEFTFNTITSIPFIAGSAVTGPDTISSTCNAIIAVDWVARRDSTSTILLVRKSSTQWVPPGMALCGSFVPDAFTTTTVTDGLFQSQVTPRGGASLPSPNYRYLLIRRDTGQIVPITSVSASGVATLSRAVSWLNTSSTFDVYDHEGSYYQPYLRAGAICDTPTQDANNGMVINTAWYAGQKSTSNPLMDGTAAIGASMRWAAADHRHPTDTSRAPVVNPSFNGLARYDPGSLGTFYEIGFRGTPIEADPDGFQLRQSDSGKCLFNIAQSNGGTGQISVNSTLAQGNTFAIINNAQNGTDSITIFTGGQIVLRWAGTGLTGNRTLAAKGMCSILVVNTQEAWITGVGLS